MTEFDDVQMSGPRLAVRIAELIRLSVAQSGFSQREIAERMGVTESRLSQISNGDGNLHVATIARVLTAAGCSFDLRVFGSDGHEVEIRRRGKRRRDASTGIFVHPVEAENGTLHTVISYAHAPVPGSPVDFPMRVDTAQEAKQLATVEYEFGDNLAHV